MAKLHEVEIHRLRPTQITVGMIEVRDKRDKLLSLKKSEQQEFLEAHAIPAVWGPDGKLYITDHHHLGRACDEAGVDSGFFLVEDDFSSLPIAQFWPKMAAAHWVHPIDQAGKPRPFEDLPDHLQKLVDDRDDALTAAVGGFDDKHYKKLAEDLLTLAHQHRRLLELGDSLDVDALLGQLPGPLVQVAHLRALPPELLGVIRVGVEPVAALVRLQFRFAQIAAVPEVLRGAALRLKRSTARCIPGRPTMLD